MSEGLDVDRSRTFAREEVLRLLDLDEPAPDALFELAADVLGARRAAGCFALVGRAPLTQRAGATAHVAALIVGTRTIGDGWWESTGDGLLAAGGDDALAALGRRIADACADQRWGPSIGDVDLTDPRVDDRVALPEGAQPGDAFVASFDPGCRVVVEVVQRDGVIGSVLGDLRSDDTADADWAWAMAIDTGPVRLPGEIIGTAADPFAAALEPRAARQLRAWAGEREPDPAVLGGAWLTRGDLWEARFRLGLPYERDDDWWAFELVASATVDGDERRIGYALARLDMF